MAGFKRKVFYVGGFDPRGLRYYYGLYKEAAERWSARTGEPLTVAGRHKVSPTRVDWTVSNEADGSQTSYSYLRWEDIVQRAWIRSPLALGWRGLRTYWRYWRHLDRPIAARMPRGPKRTLAYPPIATLALPMAIGLPVLLALIWLPWWAVLPAALMVGILGARPILAKLRTAWLLRFFIFNSETAGGESEPAIAARLDAFAADVAPALDEDWDEVLLVTHSNGSILAVPLMARLLALRGFAMPDRFALVTLGQCIPLVAGRRDATRFREQLAEVAAGRFRWYDIGSPPDGAAFHNINPLTLVTSAHRPQVELLSPRFHLFYDAATYHKGLANKYEIHFDYLRVGDRVSPLDYPSITATGRPIADHVAEFRRLP